MKLTKPWTATDGHLHGASDKLEDMRHTLGREVDHLAQVAAHMGREATTQADVVARDAGKQTGAVMNRLMATAAALGPTIAIMGRHRMRGLGGQAQTLGGQAQTLGQQAQTLGHELRQVRLTTEPRRSGTDMLPGVTLIGGLGIGLGAGIALMYLFDPERGKGRRQMLMGRLARLTSAGREAAAARANALANRTVGVMADLRRTVTSGIGVGQDAPVPAEASLEEWPEGTRIPVG